MAERRMFAKAIIDSDAFLDMPLSSQALYFHLSMRADDDGFVGNPKKIQRMIGCNEDDLSVLVLKKFIIPFESGIVVIKHWKIHNYIRGDRYKETTYQEEKALLSYKENGSYILTSTDCQTLGIPNDNQTTTNCLPMVDAGKDRLGKDRLGKVSIGEKTKTASRFLPPTLEEVAAYCLERNNSVSPERFIDYYTANGWKVGKNKMKDWKAAVRSWEKNGYNDNKPNQNSETGNIFLDMLNERQNIQEDSIIDIR